MPACAATSRGVERLAEQGPVFLVTEAACCVVIHHTNRLHDA